MQLLETSVIGLRSARHRLASSKMAPTITLFPMVHIGEAAFYAQAYRDALGHDVVLYEGVRSKIATNLTRSYRWLRLRRLGLVVQPRLEAGDTAAKAILTDLNSDEFEALWQDVPAWKRMIIGVLAPLFGLYRGLFATRRSLAKGLSLEDLAARDDILSWNEWPEAIRRVLLEARDTRLCNCLRDVIADNRSDPKSIAIVYGAAHMPAVLRCLDEYADYAPVESDWMTIFAT